MINLEIAEHSSGLYLQDKSSGRWLVKIDLTGDLIAGHIPRYIRRWAEGLSFTQRGTIRFDRSRLGQVSPE